MPDDAFDLLGIVTEFLQRGLDGLIHNFEHAAAREQLVFYQRDVRFDSGRVAIHQETDRARRGEHGDLRIAVAAALSQTFAASSFKCPNSFASEMSRTAQRCRSITSNIEATLSFATGFGTPLARAS